MDRLIKYQEDLKLRIFKNKINFGKQSKDKITLSYVETRLDNLEECWTSFKNTHQKIILDSERRELEASEYHKSDLFDQVEEVYLEFKSKLKDALTRLRATTLVTQSSNSEAKGSCVRLPKIDIPTFSGKYVEWTSFRDLFVSLVHNNSSLDDVQKLHYLKSHLQGEAEQLLRHIPITADNYTTCWAQLEGRYNNKKFLANCILKRFMNQKNITVESSSAIKELLDVTNESLHALQNLGIDVGSWDILVIYIISQKLDPESRKLWETLINDSSNELPELSQFKRFLENRFRALECLGSHNFSKQGNSKQKNATALHVTTSNNVCCPFCSDKHKLCNCKRFAQEDVDNRRKFAQTSRLCFNCLSVGHSVYTCRQSTRCHLCRKRHHTLLHPKNTPKTDDSKPDQSIGSDVVTSEAASSSAGESTRAMTCLAKASTHVLLATALINVESRTGSLVCLRSLLDQGSQASFISESAVQFLGLKKRPIKTIVSGLGGDPQSSLACKFMVPMKIQSRQDPSFVISIKAYVMNKVTTLLPDRKIVVPMLPSLSYEVLADPYFGTPNKIDLLLGAEVYSQILMQGLIRGPPGYPLAQSTKFGWILSGQVEEASNQSERCHNVVVSLHSAHSNESELLRKFWELESEHYDVHRTYLTEEEELCERLFSETTRRDESGRYVVSLPFRTQDPKCKYGNSKQIAQKRFLILEKRFLRDPEMKKQYVKVINEYLDLGHMETVEDKEKADAVYLPHHAVVRNDKLTTKVRVVFDASCPGTNGASLNQDLLVGPVLQPELRHILMNWRRFPICLVADIVKMYRQIKVSEKDVDFQRVLWRENPEDELQHFRLLRVTFGTSAAPYLAVKSLQQIALDEGADFQLASSRVLKDFYVDDLMTGCQSVAEGIEVYHQMKELLSRGGFELQRWSTNSSELLEHIQEDRQATEEHLELKTDTISKILGLTWNRRSDEFEYTVNLPPLETPVTKRRVISDIAKLFDPLGWIAPAIITAKVFIQRLWLSGIEWDQELPSSLLKDWLSYREELKQLTQFRLPRWIHSSTDDCLVELHGFADASNVAYAAVVYARIVDRNGSIHVNLVTSKTKVAPVKQVSIPRLELCGAVLVAKLLNEVSTVLGIPKLHLHAWTDSLVVLAWLKSHPSRWKTFIANRVSEVLTVLDGDQWSHVSTKQNPADCASRGVKPSDCAELQMWKQGPTFLKQKIINYKREDVDTTIEERKLKCHTTTSTEAENSILTKYSSLTRLTRVVAYCRRFLSPKSTGVLNAAELGQALKTCIKMCQQHYFQEEIDSLRKTGRVNKRSRLTSFNPFLDSDDILRVGGRLQKAALENDTKHPILIPQGSHFTKLLIDEAHQKTLHGGPQLMANYLRSKYWVINGRSLIRQCVWKCVVCARHSPKFRQQMMGQLPEARVTPSRPFLRSGVDYAGPINVRPSKGRGYHSTKGYICLFVCMATKAVHLEIVSDMTAQSFLAAFKRFVARRGHVAEIWSDNGTNFVGSAKELKALFNVERSHLAREIADWCATNGTRWHFIPPHSPNFGGLWEAGVRSTKHHLRRIIGNSTLTFEEMTTLLSQIEACLNSRPISQLPTYPDDPYPLTPGHFLVGEPLVVVPDRNYEDSNLSSLKRWQLTQRMLQDFWRKWSQEYLTHLQQRYKWTDQALEPKIGDVVLVREDDLPPAKWLFGIITDKHTGSDNLTRVVSLRCKGNVIKRPVSKLVILPVA